MFYFIFQDSTGLQMRMRKTRSRGDTMASGQQTRPPDGPSKAKVDYFIG
jgi:hypothetical protein